MGGQVIYFHPKDVKTQVSVGGVPLLVRQEKGIHVRYREQEVPLCKP